MNLKLENYIKEAAAKVKNPEDARLIKMELEDHILSKIDLLYLSGVTEEDAVERVLNEMGDAELIADSFGFVHNKENPINCHILYYTSENAKIYSPEHACEQLAKFLAKNINCPCHNCVEQPELPSLDVLIIIGLHNHKDTISHLYEYVKILTKKQVSDVILITMPIKSSYTMRLLFQQQRENPLYNNLNVEFRDIISMPVIRKKLLSQGIEVSKELYCIRHFYQPGYVAKNELERTLNSINKSLNGYTSYYKYGEN